MSRPLCQSENHHGKPCPATLEELWECLCCGLFFCLIEGAADDNEDVCDDCAGKKQRLLT